MASCVGSLWCNINLYHEFGPHGLSPGILKETLLQRGRVESGVRSSCDIICIWSYQTSGAVNSDIPAGKIFGANMGTPRKLLSTYHVPCTVPLPSDADLKDSWWPYTSPAEI